MVKHKHLNITTTFIGNLTNVVFSPKLLNKSLYNAIVNNIFLSDFQKVLTFPQVILNVVTTKPNASPCMNSSLATSSLYLGYVNDSIIA